VRHAEPLAFNTLKQNLWGGRGAGTPAPTTTPLLRQNFAASKNKKENFQGTKSSLKIMFIW